MPRPPRLTLAALLAAALLPLTACAEIPPAAEATPKAEPAAATTPAGQATPAASADPEKTPDDAKPAESPKAPAESAEAKAAREARREIDRMTLEKLRIDTELEIRALKGRKAREAEFAERARLDAEASLRAAKLAAESADDDESRAEADRRIALADAKARLDQAESANRTRLLEAEGKLLKQELDNTLARIGADAARVKREQDAAKILNLKQDYRKEPFVDGTLHVSDRRIQLNGVIADATARQVADRISFFNKRDAGAPIFIVIDNSPGGSAMAGYQILKAMESSRAPVHVVLKGSAASMASVLLALAPHSYCFERSVITHHQSTVNSAAKIAAMRDSLREAEQWYSRINEPVAKKMGVTLDEFVKRMYASNARGDWSEFGEDAVKLKWADRLVTALVDESVDTLPETPAPSNMLTIMGGQDLAERTDKNGRTYYELPPLSPGDTWLLSAPDGLYRDR